jgi:hypothetical protein
MASRAPQTAASLRNSVSRLYAILRSSSPTSTPARRHDPRSLVLRRSRRTSMVVVLHAPLPPDRNNHCSSLPRAPMLLRSSGPSPVLHHRPLAPRPCRLRSLPPHSKHQLQVLNRGTRHLPSPTAVAHSPRPDVLRLPGSSALSPCSRLRFFEQRRLIPFQRERTPSPTFTSCPFSFDVTPSPPSPS